VAKAKGTRFKKDLPGTRERREESLLPRRGLERRRGEETDA
jgi:hypothetical protein